MKWNLFSRQTVVLFFTGSLLLVSMSLVRCTEFPHARPGFQPLTIAGQPLSDSPPSVLLAEDPLRRAYEASLQGRIYYYSRVVDQDKKPVPNAMILILLARLGYGTTTSCKCRTYTD